MRTVVIAVILVIGVIVGSGGADAGQSGLVRVHNRTDFTVSVYVLDVDFYGNRSWRRLGEVSPSSSLDLPNVPAGTTVGAQIPATKQQLRPARVEYASGRPIFEYFIAR
jgi:hypothetical protein